MGEKLDREELDDPQNPNHPMVTPNRVDAPDDPTNDPAAEGQRIHDEEIADKKVEAGFGDNEPVQVNGPEDRSETGSSSDGVSANEGKPLTGAPNE